MDVSKSLIADLSRLEQYLQGLLASLNSHHNADAYTPDLPGALARLTAVLGANPDVIIRRIDVQGRLIAVVCYMDNIVNNDQIDRDILRPLLRGVAAADLPVGPVTRVTSWREILVHIVKGYAAVLDDTLPHVLAADVAKRPQRSVDRPQTEIAVRGPQEAFSDVLSTQMSQLRGRLATPNLTLEQLTVGTRYPTGVVLAYLDDIVNPWLPSAVAQRVRRIQLDTAMTGAMVASYLRDRPGSLFPTVRNSERVDLVVWELTQGKVAVLVDGDPFVLWVPATLCDFYRTSEDYAVPWYQTTFIRGIRWLGWAFGLYLPALYIALTEVNPDLVPSSLFILTGGAHTGLPFTPIVEAIVMILIIEILREAALRLPKVLATTIGTVGAIVVGTAVVKAGFVSPQIIVVLTLTALSFFTAPSYELTGTWRIVGWVMLVAGFVYGVYGIVLATLGLSIRLFSLSSFGVPYLAPLAPFRGVDWQNVLARYPWAWFSHRGSTARSQDPTFNQNVSTPEESEGLRAGQLESQP